MKFVIKILIANMHKISKCQIKSKSKFSARSIASILVFFYTSQKYLFELKLELQHTNYSLRYDLHAACLQYLVLIVSCTKTLFYCSFIKMH